MLMRMSGWDPSPLILPKRRFVILSVSEGSQRWQRVCSSGRPSWVASRMPSLEIAVCHVNAKKPVTTDATDATVTNTAGEFDFYALHHAYLCSKSHSVR